MTNFNRGRNIAVAVLIKTAEEADKSSNSNSSAAKNNSANKFKFMPYALDALPAASVLTHSLIMDRDDPARLIGGLTGAAGGYLTNKLLGDRLLKAMGYDYSMSGEFAPRLLGGLNIGAMSGAGRLIGGAIAGKKPIGLKDIIPTVSLPLLGGVAGAASGVGLNLPQLHDEYKQNLKNYTKYKNFYNLMKEFAQDHPGQDIPMSILQLHMDIA